MVKKCADGAALALDCAVKFTTVFEFADMVRNMALEEEVVRQFESFGMPTTGVEAASGSSDVGNVSYRCPAIQPLLAITDEDYALHTAGASEMPLLCRRRSRQWKRGHVSWL